MSSMRATGPARAEAGGARGSAAQPQDAGNSTAAALTLWKIFATSSGVLEEHGKEARS